MNTTQHTPDAPALEEQHPIARLVGFFAGFASVLLTFGFLWPVAPLFPAMVAVATAIIPFKNHWEVARGARYACVGVAVFLVVFVPILFLK